MDTADLNRRLGVNLRRRRLATGLSQEEFAHACGLHRIYVGAIERGERNVTLATLSRLASALEVCPLDLLSKPGP